MAKVLVGLVQRLLQRDDTQLKLLLLCTVIATVGFAFPSLGLGNLHRLQPCFLAAQAGDGGEQQRSELE